MCVVFAVEPVLQAQQSVPFSCFKRADQLAGLSRAQPTGDLRMGGGQVNRADNALRFCLRTP